MTPLELQALAEALAPINAANERARVEYDLLPIAFGEYRPLCAWPRCHTETAGRPQRYCPAHIAARRKLNAVADQHPSTDYRGAVNA